VFKSERLANDMQLNQESKLNRLPTKRTQKSTESNCDKLVSAYNLMTSSNRPLLRPSLTHSDPEPTD